jgi:flavin-dependent dehydrogenase
VDVSKNIIKTDGGWDFTADIIIGADGVNSKVRRNFPVDLFGRDKWAENVASSHEIFIARDRIKRQIDHPVLYFGLIRHGYAWVFPGRDFVTAGICGLRDRAGKNILAAFKKFLREIDLADLRDEKIFSYVLPYGSYLPSPVFKNVALVGDAAGFADPLLGEGIYYAQRSAELAAQAVISIRDGERNFKDMEAFYLPLLKEYIFDEMQYAEKIRNVVFRWLMPFDFYLLSRFMKISGEIPVETIHGIRSYKWLKRK